MAGTAPGDKNKIIAGGKPGIKGTVRLPDYPARTVSRYGFPDFLAGRNAHAGRTDPVAEQIGHQNGGNIGLSPVIEASKIAVSV